MKLSRYLVVSDPAQGDLGEEVRTLFGTRRCRAHLIAEDDWQLLVEGRVDALPDAMRDQLLEDCILVPAGEDELAAVLAENGAEVAENDVCYTVIQPSAHCQLDCGYCGQEHLARNMDESSVEPIVRRVGERLRVHRSKHLLVGWFGGEPLLGIKRMRELTQRLRNLAADAGCTYSAKIVTNGVRLTPTMASEISSLGVEYAEVSLDGLADHHDRRRPWKNGRGSFERIFGNVVAAAARDDLVTKIGIRCNVDRFNYEQVIPLMDRLVEAGVQDRLAKFYVAPIHAWGNDADTRSLSASEFAELEIEWYAAMARRGFPLAILPERRHAACMAVDPAAELIDARGKVFHCTEVSQVPAYEAADAPYGNAYAVADLAQPDGPELVDSLREFPAAVGEGEYPCARCEILPICGGGCPKLWQEGKVPCPSIKGNLIDRLQLVRMLSTQEGDGDRDVTAAHR